AHPATIGTVRVWAEMVSGVHLAAAPPCGHYARGRGGCGCLWARGTAVLTGIAMRLGGEARKGFALTLVLWHWRSRLWCWEARGRSTWPHPMAREAQPTQSDQHQLVEKESLTYVSSFYPSTNSEKLSDSDKLSESGGIWKNEQGFAIESTGDYLKRSERLSA